MTKNLKKILKKMCSYVGDDYRKIDFTEKMWYAKYEWTVEQAKNFKNWLADYFFTNKSAQKEFLSGMCITRERCIEAAEEFVWNFGWKEKIKE